MSNDGDSSKKYRAWCFTINNPTEDDEQRVMDLVSKSRYIIVGYERGELGTPHYQGYVYFKSQRSRQSVSKDLPRAHIELARGSAQSNRDYCSKDGEIILEEGDIPACQQSKGDTERARWRRARDAATSGKLDEVDDDIYIRYYGNLKKIKQDHMDQLQDLDDVCGVWYWGTAGIGKSRRARYEYPGCYVKMINKWWDGYTGEKYVLVDDVDPTHKFLGHFLKIWADRYPFIGEVKGTSTRIRPEKIIVTSQYSIEGVWGDRETQEALNRRFVSEQMVVSWEPPQL